MSDWAKIVIPGEPTVIANRSVVVTGVAEQYKAPIITGPVHLNFCFYFPVPASVSKRIRNDMLSGKILHTKKPDFDNLEKFYCDVMTGHVWVDDAQIALCSSVKLYAEEPRTEIRFAQVLNFGIDDFKRRLLAKTSLVQPDEF